MPVGDVDDEHIHTSGDQFRRQFQVVALGADGRAHQQPPQGVPQRDWQPLLMEHLPGGDQADTTGRFSETPRENALIEQRRMKREVDTLVRRLTDEVRRAVRDHLRLTRALAAAETSVDIGRQEVAVAQARYQPGLSNNLDVVTAEGNLLGAEGRRIQVLALLEVERLTFRTVLGVFDPRQDLVRPVRRAAEFPPGP